MKKIKIEREWLEEVDQWKLVRIDLADASRWASVMIEWFQPPLVIIIQIPAIMS